RARNGPQMRRTSSAPGRPSAGATEDSRFRPQRYLPALAPFAKTRARVGDVQRQHLADRGEREGVVAVVASEPRVDLGDERATRTVVRDGVALERTDRVLEDRDGDAVLRLAARQLLGARHVHGC